MDKISGRLPDLMQFQDGSRVQTKADWLSRKKEIYAPALDLAYGGLPPQPEFLEIEQLHQSGRAGFATFRISSGRKKRPISFCLQVYGLDQAKSQPLVLSGDGCYNNFSPEVIQEITGRGMLAAKFNRTELAHDMYKIDRTGGLYSVYPELSFGALAAWAWGYQRCLDALIKIDGVAADKVAITGHSRGGKAVLLAGATDSRFAFVNPNNSGAGGAGCFRYEMVLAEDEPGHDRHSETLKDILTAVPYWFGPDLPQYIGREEELPFDQHFFKAFVAPNYLLQTEALADTWANPKGSYQTYAAAKKVYQLLDCSDNIAIHYRSGGHRHGLADFCTLLDFMENRLANQPLPAKFKQNPYPAMPLII